MKTLDVVFSFEEFQEVIRLTNELSKNTGVKQAHAQAQSLIISTRTSRMSNNHDSR